jgi:hypothetical protein
MSSPKNFTCNETLRQVFICLRPPPLLGVGWGSNFVGSESGQRQSVKFMQNMVSIQHPHPSQPHTVCIHCTLTHRTVGGGGGLNQREGTPAAKFLYRSKFLDVDIFALVSIYLISPWDQSSAAGRSTSIQYIARRTRRLCIIQWEHDNSGIIKGCYSSRHPFTVR